MLKQIEAFLDKNPGVKAKFIAAHFKTERTDVNQVLYAHPEIFKQDSDYRWSLVSPAQLRIVLAGQPWLTAADFEAALAKATSPLDSNCSSVKFVLKKDCKILLEALARLLALCNQLSIAGKRVTLDFDDCRQTLSYLDRIGFFGHLERSVEVLPRRPKGVLAATYKGNNEGVVELRAIDAASPNQDIPNLLRDSFVTCAGDSYSVAAFTVLSELFGNVQEHSRATTTGFAGLQFYKGGNHIQTVISDNGLGIVGTLKGVVGERYPDIARRLAASRLHEGVALLQEVFSVGGISQVDEDGRGLGLKRSGDLAGKFKAKISVRQRDFELRIHHSQQGVSFSHSLNLARIEGTHICFDFTLDSRRKAR